MTTGDNNALAKDLLDAGESYKDFLANQLEQEIARKERIENRSIAVVTTSAVIVTASLAVGAAVWRRDDLARSWSAAVPAALSILCFAFAGLAAIFASFSWKTWMPSRQTLYLLLDVRWFDAETGARYRCAYMSLRQADDIRRANIWKGNLLFLALSLQCCGVSIMTGALLRISTL